MGQVHTRAFAGGVGKGSAGWKKRIFTTTGKRSHIAILHQKKKLLYYYIF